MPTPKVAIITAGGKGMGAACAVELAARGYTLVVMSPSGSGKALAESHGSVGLDGSVTEPSDLASLVSLATKTYGRIDAVVNNTGHASKGPLLELTDEQWQTGFELMLLGVIRMARLVTPIMKAQGGGAIVNISTFAAFEPDGRFPISSTIRAALGSFTKLYADAHASDNIRMNSLLPGFVDSFAEDAETVRAIPMGRYGTVEEIAKTVSFLLSDESSYITGQNLRVDGGITRSV